MIPGPVSGHVPIDPGAAQRPPADPAGGDAGPDAGTSFADLLAAMLAPGAPGPQLQPAAGDQAVFDRLDAAEMFNETGLFRGAAPLPSQGAMPGDAAPAEVSADPAVTTGLGAEAGLQGPTRGLEPAAAVPGIAAAETGPAAAGGSPVRGAAALASKASHGGLATALDGAPSAVPANPSAPASAAGRGAGGGRVAARTAAMVARLLAERSGAAAAQVSVQAVEGGISVLARIDRLSREERDRLRGEIAELLARHGFAGAEIMLNGEAWPLPQGEKE
jgi:hypothetical protein